MTVGGMGFIPERLLMMMMMMMMMMITVHVHACIIITCHMCMYMHPPLPGVIINSGSGAEPSLEEAQRAISPLTCANSAPGENGLCALLLKNAGTAATAWLHGTSGYTVPVHHQSGDQAKPPRPLDGKYKTISKGTGVGNPLDYGRPRF